jgi:hypothetical protein
MNGPSIFRRAVEGRSLFESLRAALKAVLEPPKPKSGKVAARRKRPEAGRAEVTEEYTAAMGPVTTVRLPARARIDLSADAPGWQRLREFARRLRGG